MASNAFRQDVRYHPVKIVIAGGFGAGKTTFVRSISEIEPLTTEEVMTEASIGIDDLRGDKRATTVAMDFGRVTLDAAITLYLFGAPGQQRFVRFWPSLTLNSIGAVVLLDTRNLADSFPSIDFFEAREIPYVAAVNCFDGSARHPANDIRDTAALPAAVPLLLGDARDRQSCKDILIALVEHAMNGRPG